MALLVLLVLRDLKQLIDDQVDGQKCEVVQGVVNVEDHVPRVEAEVGKHWAVGFVFLGIQIEYLLCQPIALSHLKLHGPIDH